MKAKRGIAVLGSLNIDQTVRVASFPVAGQTVTGQSYDTFTGGKGGNQAVAAARLGQEVHMYGCLGGDAFGAMYLQTLRDHGIDVTSVMRLDACPTGTAVIEVEDSGENRIIVVPGANAFLDAARVDMLCGIESCRCLLMQLETPLDGVRRAAQIAHDAGVTVILDPAPVCPLDDELLSLCDYLTPNETELAALTGMSVESDAEAEKACQTLLDRGVKAVLHKRGAHGALLMTPGDTVYVPGFAVNAVDTTAAGDTFNAGFATGLCQDMKPLDAIMLANAAGALSTTALGAQTAMPTMSQALELVKDKP